MSIFLGYTTAERLLDSPQAPGFEPSYATPAQEGSVDLEALRSVDLVALGLSERDVLDVVVSVPNRRRYWDGVRCHVSSTLLPSGAYVKIASGVYAASPALCLLQQAPKLSYVERILLAARFCGWYAPSKTDGRGFITRTPLATPEDLREFVSLCAGMRGVLQALEAIDQVLPNAASPMEAKIAMPFYLPTEVGGLGLPRPTLNYPIKLNARASRMASKRRVYVDVYWEEGAFGLEYQSELMHKGDDHYGQDIGRQLAIESMGKGIHMVTVEQLKNIDQVEFLAELVAASLGVDIDLRIGRERRAPLLADILSG